MRLVFHLKLGSCPRPMNRHLRTLPRTCSRTWRALSRICWVERNEPCPFSCAGERWACSPTADEDRIPRLRICHAFVKPCHVPILAAVEVVNEPFSRGASARLLLLRQPWPIHADRKHARPDYGK